VTAISILIPDAPDPATLRRVATLASRLRAQATTVTIDPLSSVNAKTMQSRQMYILVGVQATLAAGFAVRMRHLRPAVVVDFQENGPYQSQPPRVRREMAALLRELRLATATTSALAEQLRQTNPSLEVVVLPEPVPGDIPADVIALRDAKRRRRRETGELRLLWSDPGEHPQAPGSLADFVRFAADLVALRRPSAPRPQLRVLASAAAFSGEELAALRNVPVPVAIEMWEPEAEAAALQESDVLLLPVADGLGGTSMALTRALTALRHACEVLMPFYPVDAPLSGLLHTEYASLLTALEQAEGAAEAPRLEETLRHLDSMCDTAVARLITEAKRPAPAAPQLPVTRLAKKVGLPTDIGMLFGADVDKTFLRPVRSWGGIVLKGPLSRQSITFDARIDLTADDQPPTVLLATDLASTLVPPALRPLFSEAKHMHGSEYMALEDIAAVGKFPSLHLPADMFLHNNLAMELVWYEAIHQQAAALFARLLPGLRLFLNDRRPLDCTLYPTTAFAAS